MRLRSTSGTHYHCAKGAHKICHQYKIMTAFGQAPLLLLLSTDSVCHVSKPRGLLYESSQQEADSGSRRRPHMHISIRLTEILEEVRPMILKSWPGVYISGPESVDTGRVHAVLYFTRRGDWVVQIGVAKACQSSGPLGSAKGDKVTISIQVGANTSCCCRIYATQWPAFLELLLGYKKR